MAVILTITAAMLVMGYAVWQYALYPAMKKPGRGSDNALYIIGVLVAAFVVYVICAASYSGHKTDMSCFSAWADMIFKDGIGSFYKSEAFHDYPPGYMYVLWVIGALKQVFGSSNILIKMPAIICDIATGFVIYRIADKRFGNARASLISALYLFNPAVVMNSAIWGQVDSIYTLLAVAMLYFVSEKQMIKSYFMFALCIFVKPQAFIFMPVMIFGIIENVFLPKFDSQKFVKNLIWGLGAIAMIFILALPFGLGNVIEQYKSTLASYPYMTVNAFNLWGALGKNWVQLTTATSVIGYIFLVLIVAYSTYLFFKSKSKAKYYFTGAVLSLATYMLSVKMHDRYAFPTMIMLLLAFVEARDAKGFALYVLNSAAQFFNVAWVLFIYEQDINKYFVSPVIKVASVINIVIFAFMIFIAQKQYVADSFNAVEPVQPMKGRKTNTVHDKKPVTSLRPPKEYVLRLSEKLPKLTRADLIIMAVIMVVYGAIALYDLGDMDAPETDVDVKAGVTVDMGSDVEIGKIKFFNGPNQLEKTRALKLTFTNSQNVQVKSESIDSGAVFYWSEKSENISARYINVSTNGELLNIKELCILDKDGNILRPANADDSSVAALFDEQELCPERTTFRNSTYFDEIYHARTAYEFIHHLPIYEWTHPPLGKLIIAVGIMIFGMCPFGWRIAGTVIGILMIPAIFIFVKKLTKKTWLAALGCILFTFDFMHFAQTRIATIDVYVTFFIILMYYFMYKYYTMSFYDTPLKKTFIPLALSGICMGLGVASKWTGAYAGAGLAVIFFITLTQRYLEYRYAVAHPSGKSSGIDNRRIIEEFTPKMMKTLGWCVIFFVIVPIVIYCCSYIPYMMTPSGNGLKTVTDNIQSMYTYHAKTVTDATHPYSSHWYQWPTMYRPIYYYSGTVSGNIKEGISSFGNPAVWWVGIAAIFYMIYIAVTKRDMKALFLLVGYFAQLIPWMGVTRITFIYHYFPCVPFLVLMIIYSIYDIYENASDANKKKIFIGACVYTGIAVVLFAMFYPVLSGQPCSLDYANTWLKWFDSWVLLT